jgi:predicted N-formylglutamate amidohydrolase
VAFTEEQSEYVEVARFGTGAAAPAAVVTCEHASERLPPPWRWPEEDRRLAGTHWAFDPGARELALELAEALGTVAVCSRFSRLLIDPNRTEDSPELFRQLAEGLPVGLNRELDARERVRRLEAWRAYHDAIDRELRGVAAPVLLSMHSFTPIYEGARRAVEIGVLFDDETELALGLQRALADAGFRVEQNEPYSGKNGLMYAVDRHARAHGRRAVELEVRQDLSVVPDVRARVVGAVARFLSART